MPYLEDYRLRHMREEDLPLLLSWRNSDHIRANMYSDHVIKPDEHKAWFNRIVDDAGCRYLVLEFRGQPTGLSYITDMDRTNSTCLWGFYVGESDAPRGTGTALGFLSMEFIFEHEKLRKVCGEVLAFNEPSQKLFLRLGFVQEGSRREHVIRNGSAVDVILFSLLADEWQSSEASRVRDLIENRQVLV